MPRRAGHLDVSPQIRQTVAMGRLGEPSRVCGRRGGRAGQQQPVWSLEEEQM